MEPNNQAYHRYVLHTLPDGRITGDVSTNDNLDHGEPSEYASWKVSYRDLEHMQKATGLSHVGISGCQVSVYLDGKQI